MFAYMNEGNAAMDRGERPGLEAISAWEKAEGVLGVTSETKSIEILTQTGEPAFTGLAPTVTETPSSEIPPLDPEAAEKWARKWATARAQLKSARNYAEADRIRELLKAAGWEVRDKQGGSVEVVRTSAPTA
jgi:cysteinyl-tRNA synthetase